MKWMKILTAVAVVAVLSVSSADAQMMKGEDRPMEMMGMGGMKKMMSEGGMMGMKGMRTCPMMGKGVTVDVKKLDDGVTITYRSDDKKTVKRLQIMGEMMRLMQEMMELRSQEEGK